MFEGVGIADNSLQCAIRLPLCTQPLQRLMGKLKIHMKHNFFPCLLTMAGTVLSLHYESFITRLKSCPVTVAFGQSGTGKTTALRCSLGLLGADDLRFYHGLSTAKILQLCSGTSIPLGVDDPESRVAFSKVIMDLYNGAKKATLSKGEIKPTSTVVISSNITPLEQQR